jgi:hypothetical protein
MNTPKTILLLVWVPCLVFVLNACNSNTGSQINQSATDTMAIGSYAYDAAFLKKYTGEAIQLKAPDGLGRVLLSARYQGRVMTSTASGDSGTSFGWLNYALIAANEKRKQFNPVGGEERFWMGPEGGQYSPYFKGKDSFTIAHWQVPSFIDTEPWQLVKADSSAAVFVANASFANYSGTTFSIHIERNIRLLGREEIQEVLHSTIPEGLRFVGFETTNTVTNKGEADWTKQGGLLSVWLLGMFTPGPQTKVMIPFHGLANAREYISSGYFGAVPPDRLQVTDSMLYFTCDGQYRSKIGLSPIVAKPIAAAFDFAKNILTVVIPAIDKSGDYVNSKWELQQQPYKGDAINAYNDGPLPDGTQMGPFFEIESSSPALLLRKADKGVYRQTTCHFEGEYTALQSLAKRLLDIDLDAVKKTVTGG